MNQMLYKILSLLGIEITDKNDEQLLSELPLDMYEYNGFSGSFHENLMGKLFKSKESLETRIVHMFPRVALSAAAAILILSAVNFTQIKNIENLFVGDEVNEWIENSSDDLWDEF